MSRSARQLEAHDSWRWGDVTGALASLVARNPILVGGTTAFLVALSFVSANALWYQPHAHSGAFFATRDITRPDAPVQLPEETTIIIERPQPQPVVEGDPTVKSVQKTLKDLNFYEGEIDGLYGPNTRIAIEAYQNKMGLPATGTVDDPLLDHLGTGKSALAVLPSPAPRDDAATQPPAPALPTYDEQVARIQTGLREFGNEGIQVDGLMGARTEAAIREFQSLFDLPVTGRPDRDVHDKMRDIGLIR